MKRELIRAGILLALVLAAATGLHYYSLTLPSPDPLAGGTLSAFGSYGEMRRFLGVRPSRSYMEQEDRGRFFAVTEDNRIDTLSGAQANGSEAADIVKSDGTYIYVAFDDQVQIVLARPPEQSRVVSQIKLAGNFKGLYVEGNRLAVLEGIHYFETYSGRTRRPPPGAIPLSLPPGYQLPQPQAAIRIYDISDRANPALVREVSIDAGLQGSRMVGGFIYAAFTSPVRVPWPDGNKIGLPRITANGKTIEVPPTAILHPDVPDYYGTYATVTAVSLLDDGQQPTLLTFLAGYGNTVYMSRNNLYFTFGVYGYGMEKTAVHRFRLAGPSFEHDGKGEVPGRLLHAFPMDEHNGFLHILTATGRTRAGRDNIYVLDGAMNVAGGVEDVIPGEGVHSSLFAGDRAYLGGLEQFVALDLADPYQPRVLGDLGLRDFSGYLLPYSDKRVIGIGQAADPADTDNLEWHQGLQVSFFDVSDVSAPRQIAGYDLGDRGSKFATANDSKWLYFDPARGLLVVPLTLAEIDPAKYPQGISPSVDGQATWQGAYVFGISPEGLAIRGRVTHETDPERLGTSYTTHQYQTQVQRSLVIGDVLYTISRLRIKVNDLATLEELWEVDLGARFPTG